MQRYTSEIRAKL